MAAHMKTTIVCLTALVLAPAAAPAATASLIPQPVSVEMRPGAFRLQAGTAIVAPPGVAEARQVAGYLASVLAAPTGWQLKVSESTYPLLRRNAIVLGLSAQSPAPVQPEGYELVVTQRGVRIQSPTPAGLFYGVQTLLQLLPPEIESQTRREAAWTVPCVHIVDYPRFAWRGCHRRRVLHAGRHPRGGGLRAAALRHGGSRNRDARPFAGGAGGVSGAVLHRRSVSGEPRLEFL
jgi:hexosaminidase